MVTGQGREPLLHASGFLLGKDRLRLRTPAYTSRRFSLPQGTKYSSVIAIYAVSIAKQGRNVKENTMIVQYYGGDDREAAFKVKAPPKRPQFGIVVQLRWCLLHSVPHWNFIRLYLPKGSGGFRSPKTNLWLACFAG